LTPRNTFLPQTLRVVPISKIFSTCVETEEHFGLYTSLPLAAVLSQMNPVEHISYTTAEKFALILSYHINLDLPRGLFTSGSSDKNLG
jgi:hypothetical protein